MKDIMFTLFAGLAMLSGLCCFCCIFGFFTFIALEMFTGEERFISGIQIVSLLPFAIMFMMAACVLGFLADILNDKQS